MIKMCKSDHIESPWVICASNSINLVQTVSCAIRMSPMDNNKYSSFRKWWPYNLIALCWDFILFAFYSSPFDRITCGCIIGALYILHTLQRRTTAARGAICRQCCFERWLIPKRTKWKTNLPFEGIACMRHEKIINGIYSDAKAR